MFVSDSHVPHRYYAQTPSHTYPPEVHDYNARFTKTLDAIKRRHDPTVTTVAQGVLEWQRAKGIKSGMGVGLPTYGQSGGEVQAWLDRFYMSRIGIRFLIRQREWSIPRVSLIPLTRFRCGVEYPTTSPGLCGHYLYQSREFRIFDLLFSWLRAVSSCMASILQNVHDILQEAIENARFVCEEHYAMFRGPPVQLVCPPDLTFAYVPGHLSHIVFELLKNSLRAVVERFGAEYEDGSVDDSSSGRSSGGYPPIKVIVVEGSEDITIKISDEGGGIPRSAIPLIWTYMYTTMAGQSIDQDFQVRRYLGFRGKAWNNLILTGRRFPSADGRFRVWLTPLSTGALSGSFELRVWISLLGFDSMRDTLVAIYASFPWMASARMCISI